MQLFVLLGPAAMPPTSLCKGLHNASFAASAHLDIMRGGSEAHLAKAGLEDWVSVEAWGVCACPRPGCLGAPPPAPLSAGRQAQRKALPTLLASSGTDSAVAQTDDGETGRCTARRSHELQQLGDAHTHGQRAPERHVCAAVLPRLS